MSKEKMIKRAVPLLAAIAIATALLGASSAQASCPPAPNAVGAFGIAPGCFDGDIAANAAGDPFTQAGGHPYDLSVSFDYNVRIAKDATFGGEQIPSPWPEEPFRTTVVNAPPGLIGNPTAIATSCTIAELSSQACPAITQVGTVSVRGPFFGLNTTIGSPRPLYKMVAPAGVPARFGFAAAPNIPIVFDARLRSRSDYGITITSRVPEGLALTGSTVTFWGVPASPAHDEERGAPAAGGAPRPFLLMPTSCGDPGEGLPMTLNTESWWNRGSVNPDGSPDLSDPDWKTASFETHLPPGYPEDPENWGPPQGTAGCAVVPVKGTISAQPTSHDVETPTGLDVHVAVPNPGLQNPEGIASSAIKKTKVTLPEGITINPSQAQGLGVCTPAQYASTELSFFPTVGEGCPSDSKIGTVSVKSQLLEEGLDGSVFVAQSDAPTTTAHGVENPFDSLLALYMVIKNPERGILIKLAGKVETDERTGQVTTTFDDLPQLPFSSFDLHFREGVRSPLVTPPACGTYTTTAQFTPWSDPSHTITSESDFQILHGIGAAPCPTGGLPPFHPGLIAGSLNNNAGSYSPFNLRLFRSDEEQEITHFSIKLPPGVIGKLAGLIPCSDAAIAAAESKSRTGAEELTSPSCPASSEVGRTLVGAGVGSVLAYAPGKVYLAGPYHGSQLSIAAITAAKVGPFDLGTVVVRQALRIDPETAEVFIDATGSDPIPHIIDGITVHLRDIRAYVDRPDFTLNPTSCDPTSTASTVLGSGLDFSSAADDLPLTVSTRYQAANCASLPFEPKLSFRLKGATKRGQNPSLRAHLAMNGIGEAAIRSASVALPKSEFLDNAHIGTVCTRVQFREGSVPGEKCPAASVYGQVKALTPLLDGPLEGPIFLRSSEHKLPDLVVALHHQEINVNLIGRVDSVKGGGIRNSFEFVPDAPVTSADFFFFGAKKGLLENSTDICKGTHRVTVKLEGHNGKVFDTRPQLRAQCAGKRQKDRHRKGGLTHK